MKSTFCTLVLLLTIFSGNAQIQLFTPLDIDASDLDSLQTINFNKLMNQDAFID